MTPLLAAFLFALSVAFLGGWYFAGIAGAVVSGFVCCVLLAVALYIEGK